MIEVGDVDIDMMWARIPPATLVRLAAFAAKQFDAPVACLASPLGSEPRLHGCWDRHNDNTIAETRCRDFIVATDDSSLDAYPVIEAGRVRLALRLSTGRLLGTLCVLDVPPSDWTAERIADLDELARTLSARLALDLELGLRETAAAALVNINHELRTPLQAIVGFTDFLKIETKPEIIAAHANTIQTAAQSLLNLVNQTLDIAEGGADGGAHDHDQLDVSDRVEALDIRDFAKTCVSMVEPAAIAKRLKLDVVVDEAVPGSLPLVTQKIRQALLNLLNNAVKFTDHGSVTLRIGVTADRLRFDVVDTGIGIEPDQHNRLFHRFSRIEGSGRTADGSGLGLSISKDLVESLDGQIGFVANPMGGSTFWFTLPLASASVPTLAMESEELPGERRGAYVLLADDLDLNRKLISDMLGIDGHRVDCVADGAAALAAASSHVYDLILMDMIMPVMDGLAATRAIRALPAPYGKVPIVALTAHSFREQLDSCLAAGMDATLTKPMSIDALMRAVETWTRARVEAA